MSNATTNLSGWPLWTMTYKVGRSTETTTFFQPDQDAASAYAARWANDFETETGRRCRVVSVAIA